MSNVIPIVSSSPPPFDDDAPFEWNEDDDDEDFGNFASAPGTSSLDDVSSESPVPALTPTFAEIDVADDDVGSEESHSLAEDINNKNEAEKVSKSSLKLGDLSDGGQLPLNDDCGTENNCDDNVVDCEDVSQELSQLKANVGSDDVQLDGCPDVSDNFKVETLELDSGCGESESITGDRQQCTLTKGINESMYSNASTMDSGVFGSDLSPSLAVSGPQEVCPEDSASDVVMLSEQDTKINNSETIKTCVQQESLYQVTASDNHADSNSSHDNESDNNFTVTNTEENVEDDWCDFSATDNFGDFHNSQEPEQSINENECDINNEPFSTNDITGGVCDSPTQSEKGDKSIGKINDDFSEDFQESEHDHNESSIDSCNFSKTDEQCNETLNDNDEQSELRLSDKSYDSGDSENELETSSSLNVANIKDKNEDIVICDNADIKSEFDTACEASESSSVKEIDEVKSLVTKSIDIPESVTPPSDDGEDEFGSFGSNRQRTESDPSEEVPPITFRASICESEEEEGDKFDGPPLDFAVDEDEDDDFGDFGAANDDDFANFDSAPFKNSVDDAVSVPNDDDDFGDFDDADGGADDAGWADFGSAPPPPPPAVIQNAGDAFGSFGDAVPLTSEQSKLSKLERAVVNSFPKLLSGVDTGSGDVSPDSETEDKDGANDVIPGLTCLDILVDLGLGNIVEAQQQTWTTVQHPSKKDPKVMMWGQLKDVDSSHAIGYGWPSSYCSDEVFTTLRIDTKNVLFTHKKQAVPFFNSGASLLEPTRGDSKKEKKNTPLEPTLLDTSKQENTSITLTQDIPPVDFDWMSSGLTNPLTANTLDLDFLVIQGSETYEKTTDEWDWVFKADKQDSTPSGLLEDILRHSTPTAKLTAQEVLSPEAARILEKMPSLSFMLSKVLMFPIK